MPYVLDESSYRIEKNTFPTEEEAKERAEEAARILGRPITVYELAGQELHFAFRVKPCGEVDETNPLPEHVPVEPSAPAVLGEKKRKVVERPDLYDTVAETLERAGRADLAAQIDRQRVEASAIEKRRDRAIGDMVRKLKEGAEG